MLNNRSSNLWCNWICTNEKTTIETIKCVAKCFMFFINPFQFNQLKNSNSKNQNNIFETTAQASTPDVIIPLIIPFVLTTISKSVSCFQFDFRFASLCFSFETEKKSKISRERNMKAIDCLYLRNANEAKPKSSLYWPNEGEMISTRLIRLHWQLDWYCDWCGDWLTQQTLVCVWFCLSYAFAVCVFRR